MEGTEEVMVEVTEEDTPVEVTELMVTMARERLMLSQDMEDTVVMEATADTEATPGVTVDTPAEDMAATPEGGVMDITDQSRVSVEMFRVQQVNWIPLVLIQY